MFEDLDQPEVDLASFHIDAHNLYVHPIPQSITLLRVLPAQHVFLLDESVVVVCHARHVDEPLDVMLDESHEQAERRHTRDVAADTRRQPCWP